MARSSKWSVSFKFITKTVYTFLFCHMHATYPTHPILSDLIILITFHEQYKSCSFSHAMTSCTICVNTCYKMLQMALDPAQDINIDRLPPSTSFALKTVKAIYKEMHEQINLWHGQTFSTGPKHKNMAIQISKQKKDSMLSNVKCYVPVTDTL